jgi:hypothetical protein
MGEEAIVRVILFTLRQLVEAGSKLVPMFTGGKAVDELEAEVFDRLKASGRVSEKWAEMVERRKRELGG